MEKILSEISNNHEFNRILLSILHSTADYTISRVMGIYSILKALTLIQTTLYIHFKGNRFAISLFSEIHWFFIDPFSRSLHRLL